jgi:xanthine dehydrogenase YagS FAD-binding subunit
MRPFAYRSPEDFDELHEMLSRDGNGEARMLAGGTDLLTLIKSDIVAPATLVSIRRVVGISDRIGERQDGGLEIGALATLDSIESHPLIVERFPALARAAAVAASPQLRNMATIAGNLLQRPRCWYFRDSRFHCWLKGGETCHAKQGENRYHALFGGEDCVAVHPSDPAPALLAYDARVRVRGPAGVREAPLDDLFALPTSDRRSETVIDRNDVILSVTLPAASGGTRGSYVKAMDRKSWAFALVAVAAVARFDGDTIRDARIVLGGVAPTPWRAGRAESELAGKRLDGRVAAAAAEAALNGARPLEHNSYKVGLARALVVRALLEMTGARAASAVA